MYTRFTDRVRKLLQMANMEAQRSNQDYIGTEHILLGLIKEGRGVGCNALKNLGLDFNKVRLEIEKITGYEKEAVVCMGKLPHTPGAKKVLEFAIEEATALNHKYVGTEHILLGLIRETEEYASTVLMNMGIKLEDVRAEVLFLLGLPPTKIELKQLSEDTFYLDCKGVQSGILDALRSLQDTHDFESFVIRGKKKP